MSEEKEKVSTVSAVGSGLSQASDILSVVLGVVRASQARCLLLCSNSLSVTVAVDSREKNEIVVRLHEALIEKEAPDAMPLQELKEQEKFLSP